MKSEDIGALMRGVATVIKEHVGSLASAVAARQAELEQRVAAGESIKGDRGEDGKSVTIDDVRPLIEQAVTDTMLVVKAAAVDDLKPLIAQDLQGFAAALSAKFASAEHAG